MTIRKELVSAGIECQYAACTSITEYVCYNTTPDKVNATLKSIGVYEEHRAIWSSDYNSVYINRLYTNGKSWN